MTFPSELASISSNAVLAMATEDLRLSALDSFLLSVLNKSYKSYKNNGNNINALVFGKAFDLEVGHEGKILKLYIESDIDKEFNGEDDPERSQCTL